MRRAAALRSDEGAVTAIDPLEYAEGPDDPAVAMERARAALAGLAADFALDDGLAPSILLADPGRLRGPTATAFLADLRRRMDAPAPTSGPFPWHRDPAAQHAHARRGRRPRISWRPGEAALMSADLTGYLERIRDPLAIVDTLELLALLELEAGVAVAETAGHLRRDAMPAIETEIAWWILGSDPWRDTFALWVATERPHVPNHVHALLVATATRYATLASRVAGVVTGNAAPFDGVPLVSASAHLAMGLWSLGLYPSLIPGILAFVAGERRPNGSWADPGQPPDVLTTLAAADLLSRLDPDFDPAPTAAYLALLQEPAGWWRALDPEVPWLTSAVLAWLERAGRPFQERFAWPGVQKWDRDRKTKIPTYTYFSDVARVVGGVPALRDRPVPILFCDLAGFKEFNNAMGQQAGDEALRVFAGALSDIPAARAIRDGGDEFIVLGAPLRDGFIDDIREFQRTWPATFAAAFGRAAPAVAPRLLVSTATGATLEAVRERLGRLVGEVKVAHPEPGADGVLVEID